MDNTTNNPIRREPPMLIDELSTEEYYVGTSRNSNNQASSNWKIKRIWKVGNVWLTGYPNGDQGFNYVWDDRYSYVYNI